VARATTAPITRASKAPALQLALAMVVTFIG
jgi:hypothetical protein